MELKQSPICLHESFTTFQLHERLRKEANCIYNSIPCPLQIFLSSPKVPFVQIQKSNLCTSVRSEVKILLQIFWSVNKKDNRPAHTCSYCSYLLHDMSESLVIQILSIHLYAHPYLGSSLDWEQQRQKKMEQPSWINWRERSGDGTKLIWIWKKDWNEIVKMLKSEPVSLGWTRPSF